MLQLNQLVKGTKLTQITNVASGKRKATEISMIKEECKALENEQSNTIFNQSAVSSAIITSKYVAIDPLLKNLMVRQRRGRKQEATTQQKKLELIQKLQDSDYGRAEQLRRCETAKQNAILIEQETKELIVEMDTANDEDQLALTES